MKQNLEIKYRKIPSLKFLYEISQDGKYVRNVKSKKYNQIMTEVTISGQIKRYIVLDGNKNYINTLLEETNQYSKVFVVKYPLSYTIYNSFISCLTELSMVTGLSFSTVRQYLKQRRRMIKGLEIIYI